MALRVDNRKLVHDRGFALLVKSVYRQLQIIDASNGEHEAKFFSLAMTVSIAGQLWKSMSPNLRSAWSRSVDIASTDVASFQPPNDIEYVIKWDASTDDDIAMISWSQINSRYGCTSAIHVSPENSSINDASSKNYEHNYSSDDTCSSNASDEPDPDEFESKIDRIVAIFNRDIN